ncbi:hypothetical protein C1H46_027583 [Malus baccata]|uniref:WAT1-related protein n=1 Tax=Malus baccata TaxID=106549 RepID=A0A540LKG5_MALBA|nr:hypothetical protein C1H46_027583 [Malus baccata]
MEGCTHYLAMVLVQLIYAGSYILIKLSLHDGLNQIVIIVYRHVLGMVLIGPFACVLERKQRPSLSFSVAANIFLLALLGPTIFMNVYCAGLAYTTATVATALGNVIPGLTFLMAVLLGMEKLKIRSARGQAKVAGTVFCICRSLILIFWKGGYLLKGVEKPLINVYDAEKYIGKTKPVHENWIKGSALILISYLAWILNTALVYYLQAWCISHKGPVSAAMFTPLPVVIVAVFSAIAFTEQLHLCSLIGALLIIVGLYCVLWGKRKDGLVAEHTEIEKVTVDDNKVVEIYMNEISVVNPVTNGET